MSRNSKKEEEWGGIGHNQGPAIDQESLPESDKLKLTSVVKSISGGSIDHAVGADNYSADSNASAENHRARTLDGYEARWAAGFFKVAGKHVAADGLVSRRGYRRVIPADLDEDGRDAELWADNAEQLADLAKQELRGRTATVFENLVVKPLLGQKGLTVAELARRFGKDEARIYRIKYSANQKMIRARIRLDEKRYGEKPKRPQPWTPEQLKRYREEEAADREQLREQQRADEADQVYFRTVLKRCPAIAELFIQAKKSPERSRTRADLMGATNVHYSVECRIALLDRLIDRLRRLVGPAANSSDPLLASGKALRVVAHRFWSICLDHRDCQINCSCGGREPQLPNDLRPE